MIVPIFVRGQRLRHVQTGTPGRFLRYHPWRAGWIIVQMPAGYNMHTPGTEWAPVSIDAAAQTC